MDTVDTVADPVEQTVLDLWADILKRRPASVHEDFFDLGGQSLTLVHFLQEVWRIYQVELDMTELFGGDLTVAVCARAIERARAGVGTGQ